MMDFGQRETVPMTEETAHNFLQRRRRELEAHISALKGQLAPKEAELAQIDKMLAAAPPPPQAVSGLAAYQQRNSNALVQGDYLSALRPFLKESDKLDERVKSSLESMLPAETVEQVRSALQSVALYIPVDAKYARMTIKELVIQALIDHFPKGGKATEIRDFIRSGYGRDIDAASLRPQMHRLKADHVLTQEGEVWNLNQQRRRLYAQY